jgi:hypothetical protein
LICCRPSCTNTLPRRNSTTVDSYLQVPTSSKFQQVPSSTFMNSELARNSKN